MIVSLKIPDELYEQYAKRNPGDPRKALAEALETWKNLEPGVPRLIVENPELRELKTLTQVDLSQAKNLLAWAKRSAKVSAAGVDLELPLGVRERLQAQADFMKEPYQEFARKQLAAAITRALGV
jgi:hypothetical protein